MHVLAISETFSGGDSYFMALIVTCKPNVLLMGLYEELRDRYVSMVMKLNVVVVLLKNGVKIILSTYQHLARPTKFFYFIMFVSSSCLLGSLLIYCYFS